MNKDQHHLPVYLRYVILKPYEECRTVTLKTNEALTVPLATPHGPFVIELAPRHRPTDPYTYTYIIEREIYIYIYILSNAITISHDSAVCMSSDFHPAHSHGNWWGSFPVPPSPTQLLRGIGAAISTRCMSSLRVDFMEFLGTPFYFPHPSSHTNIRCR